MPFGKAFSFARTASSPQAYRLHLETAAIVGGLVLITALLGIATRSADLVAAIWPANAVLLGVMVRWPHLATPAGWVAGAAGFIIAELLSGSEYVNTLILAAANVASVSTGYYLLMRTDEAGRRLRSPMSVLHLVVIVVLASAVAGIFGMIANVLILGHSPLTGSLSWSARELVNYLALLPVILTIPAGLMRLINQRDLPDLNEIDLTRAAPAVAVVLFCGLALYIDGPGALALAVTALLWCSLVYSVFTTALLALLFSTWMLVSIALGMLFGVPEFDAPYEFISTRVAVTLIMLAPITVASVMASRTELLSQLHHLTSHDSLTGLLNRHAFMDRSEEILAAAVFAEAPVAVLMLDIDHFKKINDTYGHGAGDRALSAFASTVRVCVRDADLVGRLGGEEFAVLMDGCTPAEALEVAERIRGALSAASVNLDDGRQVEGTVSIGLACAAVAPPTIEPLLLAADEALYLAKGGGRNRIVRRDVPVMRNPSSPPRKVAQGWAG